jgi:hypothetical protein
VVVNSEDKWMGKFNVLGMNPESKLMSFLDLAYQYKSDDGTPRADIEFSIVYGMKDPINFHSRKWNLLSGELDSS